MMVTMIIIGTISMVIMVMMAVMATMILIMMRTVRGLGEREMQSRLISATIVPLRFCNISVVSNKL